MDITPKAKKAMSRNEVSLLVDLIHSNPILTTKETNAATNKMTEECWSTLTKTFNSNSGQMPRIKEQLKLKWDNLKKAARKRAANIRLNNLKTGGGKPDYIPPDEILEKVTGVLGSTCTGFEVAFGGDGVDIAENVKVDFENLDAEIEREINQRVDSDDGNESLLPQRITKKRKIDFSPQAGTSDSRQLYEMTSMSKPLQNKAKKTKKDDDGQLQRNLAIAKYYEKKAEKLEMEIKLLKLELANKENNNIN